MQFIASRHTRPMTTEEERIIADGARQGDQRCIDRLILANYRFVAQVAIQMKGRGVEIEDLIGEGVIGLRRAIETFDPTSGNKFISYAVWWIRRYMIAATRDQTMAVQLPANYHIKLKGKTEAQTEAHAEAIRQVRSSPSLNSMMDAGMDLPSSDPETDALAEDSRNRQLIETLLEGLEDIDQVIIRSRYGIRTGTPEDLQSIGDRHGLSKERIRQRQAKAETELRRQVVRRNLQADRKV